MVKTNEFTRVIREVELNEIYKIGELFDYDGKTDCIEDILKSGSVAMYDPAIADDVIVDFSICENDENVENTLVKVTSIS